MKIQNTSGWYNQIDTINSTKGADTSKDSFGQLLNERLTNTHSVDGDITAVRTGCTVIRTLSNAKDDSIKNLIKDAFSDINKEILTEIDILLDEETGENIDMLSINQLLDLCIDPNDAFNSKSKL